MPNPVAGGPGGTGVRGVLDAPGVEVLLTGVAEAAVVGLFPGVVDPVADGLLPGVVDAVGDGLLPGVTDGVGVEVPGVAEAVDVEVADAVDVAVGVAAKNWFVTVARHLTSEPPPFAEPLHWSMFTGSEEVMVDSTLTMQMNPTLVPPLPDPLHWPTVASDTDVTPGVLAGLQIAGAPGPLITEPMHWYTVARAGISDGTALKWLFTVTVQMTTPPPPLPEPLHCCTSVTGSTSVVVVVLQVPAPEAIGPAAPTQRVTVIVELPGPVPGMKLSIVTVQAMPCPPTLLAVSLLHCVIGAAAALAFREALPPRPNTNRATAHASAVQSVRSLREGAGRGCLRVDVVKQMVLPGPSGPRLWSGSGWGKFVLRRSLH